MIPSNLDSVDTCLYKWRLQQAALVGMTHDWSEVTATLFNARLVLSTEHLLFRSNHNAATGVTILKPIWLASKRFILQASRRFASRRFTGQEEQQFRLFYADKAYPKARFGVIFGFFAWMAFGFWDGLGFPRLLPELAAIRFGMIAPIIGGVGWFIVYRQATFKAVMQSCLFIAPAAAAMGLFLMMTLAQQEDSNKAFQQYWPTFSALYFFVYAFLGMRLIPATAIGLVSFVLVCVAGCRDGVQNTAFGIALLQLSILNILGIIICARFELQDRALFRLRQHHYRLSRTAREERMKAQATR